jgi:hypothetical protein
MFMRKLFAIFLIGVAMSTQASTLNPDEYVAQSYAGLQAVTEANAKAWGLGSEENWGVDLNTGKIKFFLKDGVVAEADVQVIGTYAPNGTFMWGWDHPSVNGNPARHAKLLKEFGEKYKINDLVTQPVEISQQKAWEYTALAMRLGNTNGAYRAQAGETWVYMTFGAVSLSKNK